MGAKLNTSGTFSSDGNALEVRFNGECIRIEPWGENALRARARPGGDVIEPHVSALLPQGEANSEIEIENERARLRHGRIEARVRLTRRFGADVPLEPVVVYCEAATGRVLLSEARSHFAGPPPRQFKAISSGSFQLEATFAAFDEERLMGLGQPQHGREDLKGTSTNLVQQNSHVTIPFVVSNRGYGFLWNNPATGRVDFATNITRWRADATPGLDYWITAGDSPADILSNYIRVTGTPPVLPEWATGFWQCKLRYQSQQEVLDIAREYKRRGLPLACIVIDFFAWTRQGEWEFDPDEWPDPGRLVKELEKLGVKVVVSIWPTVGANSKYYAGMRNRGQLLRTERGVPAVIQFPDKEPAGVHFLTYYDAFNPDARNFHWSKVKAGYCDHGIHNFWLASPNYGQRMRNMCELIWATERRCCRPIRWCMPSDMPKASRRKAPTMQFCCVDPLGLGGSDTPSFFGRVMWSPPGRTTALRSLPDCMQLCPALVGGRPILAASMEVTSKIPSFANCWFAGSSLGFSLLFVASMASGCRTASPSPRLTVKWTTDARYSRYSPPPVATMRFGHTGPMCWSH